MSLTIKDIQKVAHLARLHIPESEIPAIKHDLDNILALVDKMSRIDGKDIQPIAHPLEEHQFLRIDQVTEIDQRELFQKIAPLTNAGLYIVPKVIETE